MDAVRIRPCLGLDTIPPGRSIVSAFAPAPLSSGDIDYVARLYGRSPTATTISTNPPGLDIIVDGVRYRSPATFDWIPGSEHKIEAPFVQTGDNPVLGDCCNYDYSIAAQPAEERTRYVFGSWTDEGSRVHALTADPDTTMVSGELYRPASLGAWGGRGRAHDDSARESRCVLLAWGGSRSIRGLDPGFQFPWVARDVDAWDRYRHMVAGV